ncbi:MAG: SAM-dependent chlorinase/fluorinase [Phycisphaerae bacterium]|jgi:S-adenosylmethionine hydrolase|nr:SAM-dependent chlorinase/fluorinase [Phycisphaerae bacterium]
MGKMAPHRIVTLLTDFGTRDPYVAAMKGAILQTCPQAHMVDLCHDVPPHNILAGAFTLAHAVPYFPPGTLHVVVVDPGVGTERNILAARFGKHTFLFPDNGVISLVAEVLPLRSLHTCRNAQYIPNRTSTTFQGRDVFAPVAAQILNGLNIARLGPQPTTYKLLDLPQPTVENTRIVGRVIYVDNFGNLITNISQSIVRDNCADWVSLAVTCNAQEVGDLVGTYDLVEVGKALAVFNSMDLLEIAVNQGRADESFKAGIDTPVQLSG